MLHFGKNILKVTVCGGGGGGGGSGSGASVRGVKLM
jgi:hypothetical protein